MHFFCGCKLKHKNLGFVCDSLKIEGPLGRKKSVLYKTGRLWNLYLRKSIGARCTNAWRTESFDEHRANRASYALSYASHVSGSHRHEGR